jgi:hypothetical protein
MLNPGSHVSGSLFAKHLTLCNIVARLHSQITLGHKPLPDQHLDTGSLHSPTGRVSCARLNDASALMIDRLPPEDQDRDSWQLTVKLLLAAAEAPAKIAAATNPQLERALFIKAKWLAPKDR